MQTQLVYIAFLGSAMPNKVHPAVKGKERQQACLAPSQNMPETHTLMRRSCGLLQQGFNLRGCLNVLVHKVHAIVVGHAVQQVTDNNSNSETDTPSQTGRAIKFQSSATQPSQA